MDTSYFQKVAGHSKLFKDLYSKKEIGETMSKGVGVILLLSLSRELKTVSNHFNSIQDGLFWGLLTDGGVGGAKRPPSLKSVTHIPH